MINKQEIMEHAKKLKLDPRIIEKDYILGWLLAGIANDDEIVRSWVFKGGTCLKKCYFENYRFSEDLDYTLTNNSHINQEFLTKKLKEITEWIYEEAGVEFPAEKIRFEVYKNISGKISVEGRISYVGPLQRKNDPARVVLDLTNDEFIASNPVFKKVFHPYSDFPTTGINSYCYNFSEIFAEKIRALGQRLRPRDLYDVVTLFRKKPSNIKSSQVYMILEKKSAYKNILPPGMNQIEEHVKKNELNNEWENMLAHQVSDLPAIEEFWSKLPDIFDWLNSR